MRCLSAALQLRGGAVRAFVEHASKPDMRRLQAYF